jgi:hypothetical protein
MSDRGPVSLSIVLPRNRDHVGVLCVRDHAGARIAGPFPIAGRASDEIAAEHGNPTRASTLPYGDPPTGAYRYQGVAPTGAQTKYRSDLFGAQGVIVLAGTSGDAALADANGRFTIVIHGGPPAANGGLRATTGHFRIADADLESLTRVLRDADEVSCVCEESPTWSEPASVAELQTAAPTYDAPAAVRQRRLQRFLRYESLVAFGEYSAGAVGGSSADASGGDTAPLPPPGAPGFACMGMETICASQQYSQGGPLATDPYTAIQYNTQASPDVYSGSASPFLPAGQSPFFPSGQDVDSYVGGGASPVAPPSPGPSAPRLPSQPATPVGPNGSVYGPSLVGLGLDALSMAMSAPLVPGLSPFLGASASSNPYVAASSVVPNIESAGAWTSTTASKAALPYLQEAAERGFEPASVATGAGVATGTELSTKAFLTSISPNIAESIAYDARKAAGEIGLLAPSGVNVNGVDLATAARLPGGGWQINPVDVGSSRVGEPKQAAGAVDESWKVQVDDAVAPPVRSPDGQITGLDLSGRIEDSQQVEQEIRAAWASQRGGATIVGDTVDFSTGAITLGGVPVTNPPDGVMASTLPSSAAAEMPLASRALGGTFGVAGMAVSGYSLQNNLAQGQWWDATVDASSFVSSGLLTGGALVGSAALIEGGTVLGAFALGVGVGTALDTGIGWVSEQLFGVDLSPSGIDASILTALDEALTPLWADPSQPAYTQTIGWKLADW